MTWLAVLVAVAAACFPGGGAHHHAAKKHHHAATKTHHKPRPKPKPTPVATTPTTTTPTVTTTTPVVATTTTTTTIPAVTTPTITTPTTPVLPSRTGVDLNEYSVRSSYGTLATGAVQFTTRNFGMDEHDLTVAGTGAASGTQYGQLDLASGASGTLHLSLAPGTYKLYCSLYDHDQLGMHTTITVS